MRFPLVSKHRRSPIPGPGMSGDWGGARVSKMCAEGTVRGRTITGTCEKGCRGHGTEAAKNQEPPPHQQRPGAVPTGRG